LTYSSASSLVCPSSYYNISSSVCLSFQDIRIDQRDAVATCPQRVLDKRYSNVGQVRRVVRHLRRRGLNDEFNGGSDSSRKE
jgi:hypothetical protein